MRQKTHAAAPLGLGALGAASSLSALLPAEEAGGEAPRESWRGRLEATADSACTCPADRACSLCSRASFRSRSLQGACRCQRMS